MTTKRSEVAAKAGYAAKSFLVAASAALLMLGLAACEKSQIVNYKQGKYQGKTDTKPWDNEQFKGDQAAWEKAMKQRQLSQNDYKRSN
jgi:hypothetical protein